MRTPPTLFLAVLGTLATPSAAWAYGIGTTGFSGQTSATCSMCHAAGAFTPVSSLDGPLQVAPSSVDNAYTFEVTALLASVGGFDVSADGGAFATTDSGAQVSGDEVTHSSPRTFVDDVASFTFEWTAPATEGTYTLFGCGVAADGDALFTGDNGACTTLTVVVCANADADGMCDSVDNCPTDANDDQADTDADGLGDVCDACPADPANDVDADGVCADVDNCPTDANADQVDSDGNGIGDVCETSCPDSDGDGVCDDVDNCPTDANADQADSDGNGIGDVCETSCPDGDGDGVCDDVDNCPTDANADQADSDGNGIGDACDTPADTGTDTGGSKDTGDTGTTADGCTCSSSPTGRTLALLPALLGLAILRRRRSGA